MKKGFTLIELLVSLVIISVTMVFISAFVLNLKDEKGKIITDIPQMVNQAAISKELNSDANKYGIRNIIKESNTKCIVKYNNGLIRTIEINNNTIKYTEEDSVIFVKTLNAGTFSGIDFDSSNEEYYTVYTNGKKLYKYVINVSSGENIEVYYYGD